MRDPVCDTFVDDVLSVFEGSIQPRCYSSVCGLISSTPRALDDMEAELQHIVGANIRQLRKRRGMSQEQFADMVGVHRTYLGGVERGERNLSLQSIERIAHGANVSPFELLHKPD